MNQRYQPIEAPKRKIYCKKCNYCLYGLPITTKGCPECDASFDPYNPTTYNKTIPKIRRKIDPLYLMIGLFGSFCLLFLIFFIMSLPS